jgi:uncharacterized protein YcfL
MRHLLLILLLLLSLTGCNKKATTTARVDSMYQRVFTEVALPSKTEVVLSKEGTSKVTMKVGKSRVKIRVDSNAVVAIVETDSHVVSQVDSTRSSTMESKKVVMTPKWFWLFLLFCIMVLFLLYKILW